MPRIRRGLPTSAGCYNPLARVLLLMRQRLIAGSIGAEAAAIAVRMAVSRYVVRCDDGGFLAQLRYAVGFEHVPTTVAG
jgi:hypothetical protein